VVTEPDLDDDGADFDPAGGLSEEFADPLRSQ
jgi:hypothetical protein